MWNIALSVGFCETCFIYLINKVVWTQLGTFGLYLSVHNQFHFCLKNGGLFKPMLLQFLFTCWLYTTTIEKRRLYWSPILIGLIFLLKLAFTQIHFAQHFNRENWLFWLCIKLLTAVWNAKILFCSSYSFLYIMNALRFSLLICLQSNNHLPSPPLMSLKLITMSHSPFVLQNCIGP